MGTSLPASPLRYPGGKQCLASFVRSVIIENGMQGCVYAEPYAGGAGLALRLLLDGTVEKIILNDKCKLVTTFWRELFYHTHSLVEMIAEEPACMETWHKTREIIQRPSEFTKKEIAFAFFFQNRTNFSGVIDGGVIGGKNQSGKYKLDARYPKERLISLIEQIAKYRKQVKICCKDAISFMRKDLLPLGESCLTYCDPPYYEKGQALYLNAYSPSDHASVAEFLQGHETEMRWLVSYDNAREIIALYKRSRLYSFDLPYSAHVVRRGKELLSHSPNIILPATAHKILALERIMAT